MKNRILKVMRLAVAGGALMVLGACDDGDRAAAEFDTAMGDVGDRVSDVVDTLGNRLGGQEYTNAELAGLLNAVNDAEIEMGTMAQAKATDAGVRTFAKALVTGHRALRTQVAQAAQKINAAPMVPENDEGLIEDHREAMRDLGAIAAGREFDEAFLEHQIDMHQKVLDEIEDALESDRHEEFRSVLEKARDGVKKHLEQAKTLEEKFGA